MVRSAAKNYHDVTIITSSDQYEELIDELKRNKGSTSLEFREKLSSPVFLHLKYYRYLQHIGIQGDFENNNINFFEKKNYRSQENHKKFLKKIPIELTYNRLLNEGFEKKELDEIKLKYINLSKNFFNYARKDDFNKAEALKDKVFFKKK